MVNWEEKNPFAKYEKWTQKSAEMFFFPHLTWSKKVEKSIQFIAS